MEKQQCRAANRSKAKLSEEEIVKLMRHESYERGLNGRMRSRGASGGDTVNGGASSILGSTRVY